MSDESQPDFNALAAQFLLNNASKKAKAKSWLTASLPDEPEQEPEVETSKIEIISDDEFTGVGAPKRNKVDVLTNRQIANANDNLRKSLMGKKAYGKYQQGLQASKPMPRQVRRQADDESDEEEGKGKGRSAKKQKVATEDDGDSRAAPKTKKRPLSYADEIIASRANKKKAKVKA